MMKRCSIYFLNVIKEIEATFNRSGSTANIDTKALNIMLGLYGGEDLDVIFNIIIFSQSGISPDVGGTYICMFHL
jgi:hypothetical protein